MALLSSAAAGIVRPDQVGPLVVEPVKAASTAFQISTNIGTTSPTFRLPRVVADAAVAWVAEGADIDPSDPDVDELDVTAKSVKALVKISRELADDSSPAAAAVVGDGLARSIARKIDSAFFGKTIANGPSGLQSLANVQLVDAGSTVDSLDAFSEAISRLENVGSTATAFCASAATVLKLSQLKSFSGETESNVPLISQGGDGTAPTQRTILGVPLHSLPDTVIDDSTIWALDKAKSFVILRQGAQIEVDRSFFFGSDSIAVRAVIRVGFGWPHEQAVVKIAVGGS